MTKRLIVNAADYGRSPAASRGILQARRAQRKIELAPLTHPLVRQRLAERDIELTTFGALK